jgi:hypothetical protein
VPRHVEQLVTRLVAPLVVDCSASRRLVVDYSASRRLVVDNSASRRLVINYFTSAARPSASARRAARHAARRAARRRLLRLAQARRRLLRLRRASGCLSTSRGLSRGSSRRSPSTTPPCAGSSSTTPPPLRVRVPRHVARLVTRLVALLVVDYSTSRRLVVHYFAYTAHLGASARRAAHRSSSTTPCRAGSLRRSLSTTSPTTRIRVPRQVARSVTRLIVDCSVRRDFIPRQHWLCINYAARRRDVVFPSHCVDHSSRLIFQISRERQSRPQKLVGINSDQSTSVGVLDRQTTKGVPEVVDCAMGIVIGRPRTRRYAQGHGTQDL